MENNKQYMIECCPYYEMNCDFSKCECAKYKAYKQVKDKDWVNKQIESMGLDFTLDPFNLLLNMQKQFCSKFHKIDGLNKQEQDHWINAYLVCIEDECREVREFLDIYPDQICKKYTCENWKKELKKEAIDILHFVMDTFLSGQAKFEDIKSNYLKYHTKFILDVEDLLSFAFENQKAYIQYNFKNYDLENELDLIILLIVNKILDNNSEIRQCISWKHWKKPTDNINYEKLYIAYSNMFANLINLFCILGMTAEEVKQTYIEKNMENVARQLFGY